MTCGLTAAYFYFFNDFYKTESIESNLKPAVGTIQKATNDVRWKSSEGLAWLPLKANRKMHMGDSIFSGEKSTVLLKFENNNTVTLQSETLLVIEAVENKNQISGDSINVQLAYGQLDLKSTRNTEWKIKTKGKQIHLKAGRTPSKIQIEKRKELSIALKEGDATLDQNGSNQVLSKTDNPVIIPSAPTVVEKTEKSIELPSFVETKAVDQEALKAELAEAMRKSAQVERPRIVSSKNSVLQKKQQVKKIEEKKEEKIEEKKEKKKIVVAQAAPEVKQEAPVIIETKSKVNSKYSAPQQKAPFKDNSIYFHKGNELKINFFWSFAPESKGYLLQIANDTLFKSKVKEENQTKNSLDVVLSLDGKYYWRVKGIFLDGESDWSEVRSFIIKYSD